MILYMYKGGHRMDIYVIMQVIIYLVLSSLVFASVVWASDTLAAWGSIVKPWYGYVPWTDSLGM